MGSRIHPTSIISPEAEIHPTAEIGPFCVVRGRVKLGAGSVLESHVVLGSEKGITEIGERNRICAGAAVGGPPQDLKYRGEPTRLVIGNDNVIRECATLNVGTPSGGGITKVGNHGLFMAYVHIAHDCQVGDHVVIANLSQLAGHVHIEDHVKMGGVCGVNQFVRIGAHSYVAGDSTVNKDVIPYAIAQGKYAVVRATNKIGLERSGMSKAVVESIHRAIRTVIMGNHTIEEALARIAQECEPSPQLEHLVNFIKTSERGIAK